MPSLACSCSLGETSDADSFRPAPHLEQARSSDATRRDSMYLQSSGSCTMTIATSPRNHNAQRSRPISFTWRQSASVPLSQRKQDIIGAGDMNDC